MHDRTSTVVVTVGIASPPPPPPPPRKLSAPWIVIVGAVGVSAILVAAVLLAGTGGGIGSSSPTISGVTFHPARTAADATASSHGAWELLIAEGFALANATSLPFNISSEAGCSVTSYSGPLPTELGLPALHANPLSGEAGTWLFAYYSTSAAAELAVAVTGGVVTLAAEIQGANCVGEIPQNATAIPANVVDSSTAVGAAGAAGGAAFLAANPQGVTVEMSLIGGILTTEPHSLNWNVELTTCPPLFETSGSPPAGNTFTVEVNATTGAVVPYSESNSTCAGPGPTNGIGTALNLGFGAVSVGPGNGGTIASQGCASGDQCFEISVVNVTDNVTPNDFTMSVTSLTNHSIYPAAGFAILGPTGQVLVYSLGPSETLWTPGAGTGGTLLTAQMILVADLGPSTFDPSGWYLDLQGAGPFINSAADYSM